MSCNLKFKILFICLICITTSVAHAADLMSVAYGTIVNVSKQEKDTSGAQAAGTIFGGLVGLATGSGKSKSNKALRTAGGAFVGNQAGRLASQGSVDSYTVELVNGGTVRVVMENAGSFRKGDCVAVEKGRSSNMRRVSDAYCRPDTNIPQQFKQEDVLEATKCDAAKDELLNAATEDEARVAAIKMELLCED